MIVEAPPETVPSHISIHSPEAHRVALLQKTKQTISMTLGEATKNAQRWMTRMLESGDRVVRYQKMDEVFADLEGAARQGQGGRLLAVCLLLQFRRRNADRPRSHQTSTS